MKDKKELIDVIVDKLKNMEESPYRPGSWEKFKAERSIATIMHSNARVWYAAASILLCLGIGVGLWWMKEGATPEDRDKQQIMAAGQAVALPQLQDESDKAAEAVSKEIMNSTDNQSMERGYDEGMQKGSSSNNVVMNDLERLDEEREMLRMEGISIPQLAYMSSKGVAYDMKEDLQFTVPTLSLESQIMANTTVQNQGILALKSPENQTQPNNIRFGDRFELGLFVSPYATSNQMNVGGGLALSYKLTKMLSVRTGASYNSYEIQMIKNPVEASSTEVVVAETSRVMAAGDVNSLQSSSLQQLVIPNINAITGFVKSIDIPLEFKLNNANNSLYATAGMSYSAILNQERRAHYVENLNIETFANGYPENKEQANKAVRPTTQVVESSEENVNSNGFNGFLNFSIGKNIRVNKKVGFSVEPYVKIPVGQYRRSEMDYTNGGIRVMTNF